MAKLYFRFSTMNSGKSTEVLRICFNYEEQGKKVMLFTSSVDDRHGVGKITSRIGLQRDAIVVDYNMYELVKKESPDCILIDEAQFLNLDQVIELTSIVDNLNIPVIAYGLKSDFQGRLFEGSEALFSWSDRVEELRTICWECNKKASMNMRLNEDGKPVFMGDVILIGGNESYRPVCRKCYFKHYESSTGENARLGG